MEQVFHGPCLYDPGVLGFARSKRSLSPFYRHYSCHYYRDWMSDLDCRRFKRRDVEKAGVRHRFHTHGMHECIHAHVEICSACTYTHSMPVHVKMWIYGLYGLVGLEPTHIYIYAWWQGWKCMHMLWYTCICHEGHVRVCCAAGERKIIF